MELRMKTTITALTLLASTTAWSAEPSVKITSFNSESVGSRVAEICGVVSDPVTPQTVVKVIVDYKGSRPGTYNVLAGADGKFCTVVVTYRGEASASL
jgi:hypothetical protein